MTGLSIEGMMAAAQAERQRGSQAAARDILRSAVSEHPEHVAALNTLGLLCIKDSPAEAARYLERAAALDPAADILWLNLADAYRRIGDTDRELDAIEQILATNAYHPTALAAKAGILESAGRLGESAAVYRALASSCPITAAMPDGLRQVIMHGEEVIRRVHAENAARREEPIAAAMADIDPDRAARASAFVDAFFGRRKIYQPQPTGALYPFLPAVEYFDRAQFPWFDRLEAATPVIQKELAALWRDGAGATPEPYVRFAAGQPVNQWEELNHSPRWGAFFLWRDGKPQEEALARCPETAALIRSLPLLDTPGKAPTVMFSILEPHTRIPPHTGSTNIRTTVHLPLVVPPGCGFRVGGETRAWRVGEAWAFDDTIEHEAWNDSDAPRAILILDCWNPYLDEGERALVRAAGA